MKQGTKNRMTMALAVCGIGFAAVGTAVATIPDTVYPYAQTQSEWTTVNTVEGGDSPWTVGEQIIQTGMNGDSHKNFLVKKDENAVGNYSVSAHFRMTEDSVTPTANAQIGIVPFYLDENNYVMFNLWWREESWCGGNGKVLCNITMEGKQKGEFIHVYNGTDFVATQFSDIWIWNNQERSALHKPINDANGWTVTINKRVGDPGWTSDVRGDVIEVVVNGVVCGFYTTDLTANYRLEPQYTGISARNVQGLTITDFQVNDIDLSVFDFAYSDYNYNPLAGAAGVYANGKGWSVQDGSIVSAETTTRAETPYNAIQRVDSNYINYKLETDLTIGAQSGTAGLTVWQRDHNNYLNAMVVKNGTAYSGLFEGKINGQAVSEAGASATVTDGALRLTAKKSGAKAMLLLNGNQIASYSDSALTENGFAGAASKNTAATFAGFAISQDSYVSFDEYNKTVFGENVVFSSKSDGDFGINETEKTLTVDSTDFSQFGYAVSARDTFGKTEVKVRIQPVSVGDDFMVGVIGYYVNADSFLYAYLDGAKAKIVMRSASSEGAESDTVLAEKDYPYDGTAELAISMICEEGKASLYAGVESILTCTVEGLDPDQGKNGGVLFKGANVSFSLPEYEGWRVYDPITKGDFSCVGPTMDTWMVNGNEITGNASDVAVQRNSTYALREIDYEYDYYVYGVIHVSASAAGYEKRAAYYPWYLNENNYVVVHCSHLDNMNPEVFVEAKIGGQVRESRWDNFSGVLSIFDRDVTMEVYVGKDRIQVFNGKNEPFFTYEAPGIRENAEGMQVKAGVGVVDLTATFKDFTVSKTRVGVNTVAPTLQVIGTPVTSGKVGSLIALAVVDVSDDQGESINPIITVKDGDGTPVALENGRLRPTKAGTYTVTVTATDSWGNEAQPYSYTIEITDEGGGSSETPDKLGDGAIAGICVGAVAVAAVVAVVTVLLVRKSKKSKKSNDGKDE